MPRGAASPPNMKGTAAKVERKKSRAPEIVATLELQKNGTKVRVKASEAAAKRSSRNNETDKSDAG